MNKMIELCKKYKWPLIILFIFIYSIFVYLIEKFLCDFHFMHEHILSLIMFMFPLVILFILLLISTRKKDKLIKEIFLFKTKIEQLENNFTGFIFYVNENNIINFPNIYLKEKLGFDPSNLLIEQVFDPKTTTKIFNLIKNLKDNNSLAGEEVFISPNYYHFHLIPVQDSQNENLTMVIAKDVTDEKIKENEIRKNEYKFRNIFEQSKVGMWIVNFDGYVIDINPYLLELLGYESKEEFGMKKFSDVVFYEDQDDCCKLISGVINNQITQWKSEKRLIKKNGKVLTCSFNGCVISEDEGKSWLLLSFIDDISDLKIIESEKAYFQYLLNTILDYIPDLIILKDAKTFKYLVCNKAFENYLGESRSNIVNTSLHNFLNGDTAKIIEQNNQDAINSKSILDVSNITITNKKNISKIFNSKTIPILDNENQVKYILSIYRDLTEQLKLKESLAIEKSKLENRVKERTYELETSLHNLEQLNIQKSKFISSLSHELRTPLNAIIGFSELLNNQFFGDLNDKQISYVNLIHSSAKHLLEMINDLLDISKIDAGADSLNVSQFEIREFLESIIESFGPLTDPKKIKINCLISRDIDKINADKRKCKQILLNIISNAIKFSLDNGEITVKVLEENEQLKFEVTDSGIGIDPLHIDKIFSDFCQVGDSYSSPKEGTGIGLSLCRRLVNLHGGKIGVISELEKGSTFWFTIPNFKIKKTNGTQQISAYTDTVYVVNDSKNILLVEDNQINLSLFLDILSIEDYDVVVARNGAEALALAKEHNPTLILLDIFMPEMDGLTVVQKLRELEEFKKTPIIAVTASVGEEARKAHINAGFTDQIDKPVKVKEMLNTISKYL